MNKLIALLLFPLHVWSQQDCDNYAAIGASYILPRSVSIEGAYFFGPGFTAGIGTAYTVPAKTGLKEANNGVEYTPNILDIYAYAGYRVLQIDYRVSAFLQAGMAMGDVNGIEPIFSAKVLFPSGRKAFGIEPFYMPNRGMSARALLYFKL